MHQGLTGFSKATKRDLKRRTFAKLCRISLFVRIAFESFENLWGIKAGANRFSGRDKAGLERRDLFSCCKMLRRHRFACFALRGQMENYFGPFLEEVSDLVPSAASSHSHKLINGHRCIIIIFHLLPLILVIFNVLGLSHWICSHLCHRYSCQFKF